MILNSWSQKRVVEEAEGEIENHMRKVERFPRQSEVIDRWSHDKFNENEQAPKSRDELAAIYGYDIRNEDAPPHARRNRRYGRGPNKYTRTWEDEEAYRRQAGAQAPAPRKPPNPEDFPELEAANKLRRARGPRPRSKSSKPGSGVGSGSALRRRASAKGKPDRKPERKPAQHNNNTKPPPKDKLPAIENLTITTTVLNNKLFRFNVSHEENQVTTHKSPLDGQMKSLPKLEKKIKILKHTDEDKPVQEDYEAKDKGPLRLEAKVLQYQSPSLLYVSLVHQQKTFNLLFEKIQTEYSKPSLDGIKKDWKEGDRCCAFCEESKTWRRAVIVELEDDKAKLFYSDFALVEAVPLDSLRVLTPDFESLGDAAIKCHLCGVMSGVGTEWPSITKEFLKELLEVYKRIFITNIGNFKDRSMPVELWVYHTTQGGALEPDTFEWRCLNKRIVEQGLAIPDKSFEPATEEGAAKDDDDEMLSFLNVTGSVREWPQLAAASPSPDASERAHEPHAAASNTVFVSDWLPAEPLPAHEFTAVPTYIDDDGVVYLHVVSQQETLELIRRALDVRFKKPDPKAKFAKWTVGEPCAALYFLDNRFYRGRVLEVNKESSSCLVQYVDYGNEEICSFVNMRQSIALHEIPIQAHKCILARIRPIGNQWDRTTLGYIHKSVVEKQCLVKVAGERVGDLLPIELKYDKLWINDHLADFEMAQYTDGSKIRKFAPEATYKKHDIEGLKSDSGPD